ncbi:uncharacterized protein PHALS_15251 [Plasmopara halstedii]|uniref:RxLR-like protein n=1 Tax=Plasmopara halstedii TaxID=4781 RepID=A0A0P1B804_PLAHL|nr:uncharacterized protein PHALS_15251 [Plasmopara halstedii]CEG50006.1 hypothetical protein PHALS_15251 [Plasmopara halstedii]|eukprot:XP_024586375.1 hypothetical protein PHALS_15251 [Plasmopara halstedii]
MTITQVLCICLCLKVYYSVGASRDEDEWSSIRLLALLFKMIRRDDSASTEKLDGLFLYALINDLDAV